MGFAVLLMALALTLTMSRSGMLGLLAALVISGWFVARRQATGSRRAIVVGYLIFVALVAAGWTGFDRIAARFSQNGTADIGGRLGIWFDTWRLAGRFPIVGTGLNTYGAATLFYQTVEPTYHFAEAHNDYLQLLAEGGARVDGPSSISQGVRRKRRPPCSSSCCSHSPFAIRGRDADLRRATTFHEGRTGPIAELLFTTEPSATDNLAKEGVPANRDGPLALRDGIADTYEWFGQRQVESAATDRI